MLGRLYEDMKGYAGSPDWRRFDGLSHTTGSFLFQARLNAEATRVGVEKAWTRRVVVGPGGEKKASPGGPDEA